MSILDLHEEATGAAIPRFVKQPTPEPKFSAWQRTGQILGAPFRGVGAAVSEISASAIELMGPFGATVARMEGETAPPDYARKMADEVRAGVSENLAPDPASATAAEQVLYGFARGASKVVIGAPAGPVGFGIAGAEEATTQARELQRKGVDDATAWKAGAVQGAGLALAALPLVGKTVQQTAALYLAGGPGGFVAQQALTREILRNGGYDQIADQYDPLDPVGLAVSALVPAVFTAAGLRAQKRAAVSREVEDAARVMLQAEQRQTSNPAPDTVRTADAHEAALVKAEEAIAKGEPVRVDDVAPRITAEMRAENFAKWFEGSKVVDDAGAPLVVYHATRQEFESFAADSHFGTAKQANQILSYAERQGIGADQVAPVFLNIKNPKRVEDVADWPAEIAKAKAEGHDGLVYQNWAEFDAAADGSPKDSYVAFRPEQVKSAIGNSGRFDPNSPSLTDPISELGASVEKLRAVMDEVRVAGDSMSAQNTQAGVAQNLDRAPGGSPIPGRNPEAAGDGQSQSSATPAASAEATSSNSRIDAIRAQFPDLMVQLDGMEKPMRLDDFLAAVKAEADEMSADAPLFQVAAECALLHAP